MIRRLVAASALPLALLLAAGCSSDGSDDSDGSRPTGSATPTGATGSPSQDTLTPDTPDERAPAVSLPQQSGESTSCVQGRGTYLLYDRFRVTRPVRLAVATFTGAQGVTQTGAFTAPMPQGAVPTSGLTLGQEPPPSLRGKLGWSRHVTASGARLGTGWHYFFVQFDATRGTRFDGVQLAWTEAGGGPTGQVVYPAVTSFERKC